MTEQRKIILNMLKEGRISVEEADILLEGIEGKNKEYSMPPPPLPHPPDYHETFKEGFSKFENFINNLGSTIETIALGLGNILEKKMENFVKTVVNKHRFTNKEIISINETITKLKINNFLGEVNIIGEERTDIELEIEKLISAKTEDLAKERLKDLEIKWIIDNESLEIILPESSDNKNLVKDISINLILHVPNRIVGNIITQYGDIKISNIYNNEKSCKLKSNSGDINIKSLYVKDCEIETISGDVKVKQIKGKSFIKTASGNIDLTGDLKGESRVNTISGNINSKCNIEDILNIQSTSGDISFKLLSDNKGKLNIYTISGDININGDILSNVKINSASGDIEGEIKIVNSESSLEVSSNSGDIHLTLDKDSNCKFRCMSKSGSVESKINTEESSEKFVNGILGKGEGSLFIQTLSGDILLMDKEINF